MATIIDDGWVYLTDGTDVIKAQSREVVYDEIWNPEITHYVGGGSYGYDLGMVTRVWKVKGILFDSHTKYDNFVTYLRSWQTSGTITLGIYRNSSSAYWVCDGTNTTYTVLVRSLQGARKLAPADGDVWEIGMAVFEEAG